MEISGSMFRIKVIVQNGATLPKSVSIVFHYTSDSLDTKNLDSFLIVIIAAYEDIVVDAVSNLLNALRKLRVAWVAASVAAESMMPALLSEQIPCRFATWTFGFPCSCSL